MSKIGQSIIDTKNENIAESTEPMRELTPEELKEAEKLQALHDAKSTLAGYLFDIVLHYNNITYHAVYLNDEQTPPNNTVAIAVLASIYTTIKDNQSKIIAKAESGEVWLHIYASYLWQYDDVKSNHIPF